MKTLDLQNIYISREAFAPIARIAEGWNMSPDEATDRILKAFALDPISSDMNQNVADEATQIICAYRAEAKALAKSVAAFCAKNHEKDPRESLMHVSVVQYSDGWGVKAKRVPLTRDEEKEADRLSKKEHGAFRKRLARQAVTL